MKKYLVVCAHCDDEILGAGATMKKLIEEGNEVSVACMTDYAITREDDIKNTMLRTHKELGVAKTFVGNCRAMEFERVSHVEKVRFIEKAIEESECDVIITHSDKDLHYDHQQTYQLVLEAMRLPQRFPNENKKKIIEVMTMEVLSASDWSVQPYEPTTFVQVTEEQLKLKIALTEEYEDVIRETPHTRSHENIFALATYRGAQAGYRYAEAFKTIFKLGV